jgi:hypothetical protein
MNTNNAVKESAVSTGKVEAILNKEVITPEDTKSLTDEERKLFKKKIAELCDNAKDNERTALLSKLGQIAPAEVQHQLWENNHTNISATIAQLMYKLGRMPTKAEVARATGLSRVTIYNHLKQYRYHEIFAERKEEFRYMEETLMAALFKKALQGDVKSARLYFEMAGLIGKAGTSGKNVIENQHNYIQINNIKLSQEEVQKLSPEKLTQIEEILKKG